MTYSQDLTYKLARLHIAHRDLDYKIQELALSHLPNFMELQRLKKEKMSLKDQIKIIEASLIPDIIA